jgi:hypothetical protein
MRKKRRNQNVVMVFGESQGLDGLRGYASLWVVLGHICNLTNCNIPILRTPSINVKNHNKVVNEM